MIREAWLALWAIGLGGAGLTGQVPPPERTIMLAAEIGVRAPDALDGQSGNPFASAFIALLEDETLPLGSFGERLRESTNRISGGLLTPDIGRFSGDGSVRLGVAGPERRVALVLIHSAYRDGLPVLAGAAHDAVRLGAALRRAGFVVEILVDPDRGARGAALARLERLSAAAEIALIYTTGHGIMHDGTAYLLDSDFVLGWREEALAEHAVRIEDLGAGLRAKKANLVLFGGCRTYEWWG